MNYAEMSDFEINKAVAIALGHKCYYGDGSFTNGLMGSSVVVKGNGVIGAVNFCNSWADAGPIIEQNKISLAFDGVEWWADDKAKFICDDYVWKVDGEASRNPIRAAMIVFLMMQGDE